MWNMFKVNNKDTRIDKVNDKVKNKDTVDVVLASLVLTLNTFDFLLQCFYCWLLFLFYMLIACLGCCLLFWLFVSAEINLSKVFIYGETR